MDNKDINTVPYIVYESAQARSDKRDKRFILALIILTIALFVSNLAWLYAWTQYDYVSDLENISYSQDGTGFNNINKGYQGDVQWDKD